MSKSEQGEKRDYVRHKYNMSEISHCFNDENFLLAVSLAPRALRRNTEKRTVTIFWPRLRRCYVSPDGSFKSTKLSSLLSVLQDLDDLQRGMPVSFLKTLLLVGMDEGQTAAEYGRRAGVDRFQMARYMKTLGRYNVKRKCDGFGWVKETPDKRHRNQKAIFLTPAGREFLTQISEVLECGKVSDTPLSR